MGVEEMLRSLLRGGAGLWGRCGCGFERREVLVDELDELPTELELGDLNLRCARLQRVALGERGPTKKVDELWLI